MIPTKWVLGRSARPGRERDVSGDRPLGPHPILEEQYSPNAQPLQWSTDGRRESTAIGQKNRRVLVVEPRRRRNDGVAPIVLVDDDRGGVPIRIQPLGHGDRIFDRVAPVDPREARS